MPTPQHPIYLVEHQARLDACCAALTGRSEIGLDTEFVRTDTYRPRLCLVQLASSDEVYCVDALAGLDTTGLWNLLASADNVKLVHAAKQDLEVLRLQSGRLPVAIFDTQIAAGLLGAPAQIGYAGLVQSELGVALDKSHTRTDWSRRPLTTEQIAYAGNDVAYLPDLYGILRERLEASGRLRWAEEDSAALLDPALYDAPPQDAWRRLGGVTHLPVAVQARVRRLAAWREDRAAGANRPRQWILSDQALLSLAHADVGGIADLGAIEDLPAGTVRKSGEALLAELRKADADLASGSLALVQLPRPAPAENGAIRRLSQVVQAVAANLNVVPEILATRSDLTALYRGSRAVRPLQGWRRAVIGEALLAAV
jgi:ribonuclease D